MAQRPGGSSSDGTSKKKGVTDSLLGVFRTASATDPLLNPRSLRAWAKALPANDPLQSLRLIGELLDTLAVRRPEASAPRVQAVLELDRVAQPIQDRVRHEHLIAGLSTEIRGKLLLACDDLARRFVVCYEYLATSLEPDPKARDLLAAALARLLFHRGVQAKLGLFRFEQWIPGKWKALHELFQRAQRVGLERAAPLVGEAGAVPEPTSPEHEYLQILLLQRINTGSFLPLEIEWASQWLRVWARNLTLAEAPSASRCFGVDLEGAGGLLYQELVRGRARVLYVDTLPLLEAIRTGGARLEREQAAGARTSKDTDAQIALLRKLDRLWSPYARPVVRRGQRRAVRRYARVAVGIGAIIDALSVQGIEAKPDPRWRTFADASELHTFGGHVRARVPVPEEIDYREQSWRLIDTSDSGCRLVSTANEAHSLQLGTLLGLFEREERQWRVGVVRRVRKLSADETELGLEYVASDFVPTALRPLQRRSAGYSIDGVEVRATGKPVEVIYVPPQPHARLGPVRSMLLPATWYELGGEFLLRKDGQEFIVRLGAPVERHGDWVWTQFDLERPGEGPVEGEEGLG